MVLKNMVKAPWETYGVFPLEPGFLAPTFPPDLGYEVLGRGNARDGMGTLWYD